jgi:hypothetical protein
MNHRVWITAWAVLAAGAMAPSAAELPRLFPDYVGVTIPPNIAPLNFQIQEPGDAYRVELRSAAGSPIVLTSRSPAIRIPPKAWRSLLRANAGQTLYWDISAQAKGSSWTRFATVTNQIAPEEIDSWLAYRLLKPIFNYYTHLGIYQRNLESFEQRPILEKDKYGDGCLNCHTPLNRNPDTFAFNIRAHAGKSPMIMVVSNEVTRVEQTMGYLAWHPDGRLLAFSANKFSLFFHTRGETQDVFDGKSDLGIYDLDANTVVRPKAIASPDRNETWPTWSPDGGYLYFSSAPVLPVEQFREVRYDVMRVSFNRQASQWGEPELMISAAETGQSICQPKVSPDGRFLVVTLCPYGNFPIHQPNSDLYVMDLGSRKLRRLEINSDRADTWHSWSSNSRWLVFSSKRIDGQFARPHFSYVDKSGEFHKPFVLPQEDPTFYGYCLNTFNVPELMSGPVTVKERDLVKAVVKPGRVLTPQGPTGPSSSATPRAPEEPGYRNIRE